jgi:hypothetical protein
MHIERCKKTDMVGGRKCRALQWFLKVFYAEDSAGTGLAGSTPQEVVAFLETKSSILGISSGIRKGFETTSSYNALVWHD